MPSVAVTAWKLFCRVRICAASYWFPCAVIYFVGRVLSSGWIRDQIGSYVLYVRPLSAKTRFRISEFISVDCSIVSLLFDVLLSQVIPLYGRGGDNTDPREKVPPRPRGQRTEAPQVRDLLMKYCEMGTRPIALSFKSDLHILKVKLMHSNKIAFT
ncbi:unnamed protein product [Strongylus vulgaris]|uniref:Uncharacterized protein n=1 Tax=Strongylus vulgaris TaxID=40348 RepID=A0A3P7ISQ6_STRVU|nr:unnamed protein product [Strongylus vulgaris]